MKNLILILLFSAVLRCLFINADVAKYETIGTPAADESFIKASRNKALFGEWQMKDDLGQNTQLIAPIFGISNYVAFKVFGVSYATARLVSVLFGLGTIVLLFFTARSWYGKRTATVATFLYGISYTSIMYNRIAIVESSIAFFVMLALFFLKSKHPLSAIYFGVSVGLVIISKLSGLFCAIPLFLILLIHSKKKFSLAACTTWIMVVIYFAIFILPNFELWWTYHADLSAGKKFVGIFQHHPWEILSIIKHMPFEFFVLLCSFFSWKFLPPEDERWDIYCLIFVMVGIGVFLPFDWYSVRRYHYLLPILILFMVRHAPKPRIFISAYIIFNLTLFTYWSVNRTYTFYQTSKAIGKILPFGTKVYGMGAQSFMHENGIKTYRIVGTPNMSNNKQLFKDNDITHFISWGDGESDFYGNPELEKAVKHFNARIVNRFPIYNWGFKYKEIILWAK